MTDYYKVLEIERGANEEEVKKAYKKMAIKHHPDKGGDEDAFKKVAEAYEVLSNKEKRRLYDMGVSGHPHVVNPHDIFRQFFGGGGPMMATMSTMGGMGTMGAMGTMSTMSTQVVGDMKITTETIINGNTRQETITETNMRTGETRVQTKTETQAPCRQSFEIFFG